MTVPDNTVVSAGMWSHAVHHVLKYLGIVLQRLNNSPLQEIFIPQMSKMRRKMPMTFGIYPCYLHLSVNPHYLPTYTLQPYLNYIHLVGLIFTFQRLVYISVLFSMLK